MIYVGFDLVIFEFMVSCKFSCLCLILCLIFVEYEISCW